MINGDDKMAQSALEEMLTKLPDCSTLCEVTNWVDPLHGIEIQQMAGGNLLERPKFRSSITLATPHGPTPVMFEIDASTIHEAQRGWKAAAQAAIREFDAKMRAAQRRVIVPGMAANVPMRAS